MLRIVYQNQLFVKHEKFAGINGKINIKYMIYKDIKKCNLLANKLKVYYQK